MTTLTNSAAVQPRAEDGCLDLDLSAPDPSSAVAGAIDVSEAPDDHLLGGTPWKTAPRSFGRRLKAQRERRGISLETVADSVKVKVWLLADLERGDLSKWPNGIFGRGFIRAYATAIGLAPEQVVAAFSGLCPDEGHAAGTSRTVVGNDLRLTLAGDGRPVLASVVARAYAAALEAGLIVTAGFVLASLTALDGWATSGAIALLYYPLTSACFGRSLALWWLNQRQARAARHGRG